MRPVHLKPASSSALHADEETLHTVSPTPERSHAASKPPLGRAPSRHAARTLPGEFQRRRFLQRTNPSQLSRRGRHGNCTQGHDGGNTVSPKFTAAEMLHWIPQMDHYRSNLGELCQFVEQLTLVPSHDGTTFDSDPIMAPPFSTAEALRLFDANSKHPVPLDALATLVGVLDIGIPDETSHAEPATPPQNSDLSRLLWAISEKNPSLGERLACLVEQNREPAPGKTRPHSPKPSMVAPYDSDIATMLQLISDRHPELGAQLAALCELETGATSEITSVSTSSRSSGS